MKKKIQFSAIFPLFKYGIFYVAVYFTTLAPLASTHMLTIHNVRIDIDFKDKRRLEFIFFLLLLYKGC
jgi:hypothetical protein